MHLQTLGSQGSGLAPDAQAGDDGSSVHSAVGQEERDERRVVAAALDRWPELPGQLLYLWLQAPALSACLVC